MNPVVHFEMPFDDRERMARFYARAFGWQTQHLGAAMGDYVTATTTDASHGVPAINGGFFPRKPEWPAQVPSVVIAVDDINAAMRRVKTAGGTVLGAPVVIPGIGPYVSFVDTEGNRASLLQPLPRQAKPKAQDQGLVTPKKAATGVRAAARKTAAKAKPSSGRARAKAPTTTATTTTR